MLEQKNTQNYTESTNSLEPMFWELWNLEFARRLWEFPMEKNSVL